MKVQIPWLNKAAGRSANTIYQSYLGATYTRSMPAIFHYPDTKKQQTTQAAFFDIQRVWIPIFQQLSVFIAPSQRRNKNVFNKLSSYIYKIIQPFQGLRNRRFIKFWGLERLNLMYADMQCISFVVNNEMIILDISLTNVVNKTKFQVSWFHFILFNLSSQLFMYQSLPRFEGSKNVDFRNTLHWNPTDDYLLYVACSDNRWLGNFKNIAL